MKRILVLIVSVIVIAALILFSDIGYLRGLSVSEDLPAETPEAAATEKPVPTAEPEPTPRGTIYLTFDDGPYMFTEELLDVLEEENVKATFFVTDQNDDYISLIAREFEDGHSVGAHSCGHEYREIYKSDDALFADFECIQKIIKEQTGSYTRLYRFPGGSSNTVSAEYCDGIITRAAQRLEKEGFVYFDWDIASGDSDGIRDSERLTENVMEELEESGDGDKIILMHDIYEWTVDAVPEIINRARDKGYIFAALSPDSYVSHFEIAN